MKILSQTRSSRHGCFVVVARIRVRTGEDDEPRNLKKRNLKETIHIIIKFP